MEFLTKLSGGSSKKEQEEMQAIMNRLKQENLQKTKTINELQGQIDRSIATFEKLQKQAQTTPPQKMLDYLQNQLVTLELKLENKETLIKNLKNELSLYNPEVLKNNVEAGIEPAMAGELRYGISAENRNTQDAKKEVQPKTQEQVELIRKAIRNNMFFRELDMTQMHKLIDYMIPQLYNKNSEIISEGESGTKLYVLESGTVEIYRTVGKEHTHMISLTAGTVFGELAILYNCKRTASVVAKNDVKVWCLDRKYFQVAIRETAQKKRQEYLRLLKTVPNLKSLSDVKLMKIADCLVEARFRKGEYILRQGDTGDTFYIIQNGKVAVTRMKKKDDSHYEENLVCYLQSGEYFGEAALLTEERRTANVLVDSPVVVVLMLERNAFNSYVGSIADLNRGPQSKDEDSLQDNESDDFEDTDQNISRSEGLLSPQEEKQVKNTPLHNLQVVRVLGQGGFGCVKLVLVPGLPQFPFALKSIRKARIVKSGQEQHIIGEKTILMAMKSTFIGRLYRTYKDELKVYLLMDAYLGGELYHLLKQGALSEDKAKFCSASVLEALEYLHIREIAYRDMKPENLMVDHKGYVKLVDFGFAKRIKSGHKTYTFCGTPEYFPPEILANKGHDISADIWSFGILIYELLSKTTPFFSNSDIQVYESILNGIEGVRFNKRIPKSAESLIRGLCKSEPRDRLGYQKNGFGDVRKHRWYQGFDWHGMRNHLIKSPLPISVSSSTDTRNFDQIVEDRFDANEDKRIIAAFSSKWDEAF